MKPNQLIIIGGGYSITEGVKYGLKSTLRGRFTCGINYSYRYFNTTFLACMNYTDFYNVNRKELAKLPLIVSCNRPHPSILEDNTILVKKNYMLSGIFAINVGMRLLEEGEIFLLGYDYSAINNKTHFYQGEINHRGIGKDNYYNRGFEERDFERFSHDKKIKIYNVSMNSKINVFSKISYNEFFKKLDNEQYNQKDLVEEIKRKLYNEKY